MSTLRILVSTVGRAASLSLAVGVVLLIIFFPYDTDAPLSAAEMAKERDYYGRAFAEKGREVLPSDSAESAEEERYVKVGQTIAKAYHIEEDLNDFIQKRKLAGAKALDVGSGRGYLQDMVADYTGLDISPTASCARVSDLHAAIRRFLRPGLVHRRSGARPESRAGSA